MSESRFSLNLDSAAGLVTSTLILGIALTIFMGSQVGVRVTLELPPGDMVGPFETLTLEFSEPVDESLVIEKFFIQPEVQGKFEWSESKTMRFVPTQPFELDKEYTLVIAPGLLNGSGKQLKKPQSWKFTVRPPRVVYMVTDGGSGALWTINLESGNSALLTENLYDIYGFDVSRDGEFLVFSAFNAQGGADLWSVQRIGGGESLLLDCGPDRCSVPAISPDGRLIAYVREAAAPTTSLAFGSPRVWLLNLDTREDAPLYEDRQIIGYDPEWSPDGTRLSSYDGIKDEIRLLDMVTTEQVIIPSQIGSPVTWSGDGSTFVYTDMGTNEFGVHSLIRRAMPALEDIITLFGERDERDYYYNSLAWSPAADRLVIGLRPRANDASAELWLMNPGTLDGEVIADQPDHIYNNPKWDPWGRALVFQQFSVKGSYKPEIAIWMPGFDQPRVLGEGLMPQWLP